MANMTQIREERRSMTFRMPTSVVDMIDRAATYSHKDRTAFIVEAAAEKAEQVLLDQTYFELSADDYTAFVDTLDHPPEPSECLKALARKDPLWAK